MLAAGCVVGVRAAADAIAALDDVAPKPTGTEVVDPEGTAETGPPTEEDLANPVDCQPAAVELSMSLASASVAKGAETEVPVTVTNAGQVPCLLDVGGAELVLTVYSGEDKIWDSRHCGGTSDRRILLDIGAQDVTTLTWPGTRSASGCPDDPAVAEPGTYRVVATLLTAVDEESDAKPETVATTDETFTVR